MIKLIKLNAKRALNKSHTQAVSQVLILSALFILYFLISTFTYTVLSFDGLLRDLRFPPAEALWAVGIITLLFFLIASPLISGIKAWYWSLSEKGEGEDLSCCFRPFESGKTIFNSMKLAVSLAVKKLLTYGIFTFLPLVISFYSYSYYQSAQTVREMFLSASSLFCGVLLIVLTGLFAYIRCLKYSLVYYAFVENEFENVRGAYKMSALATEGQKGTLLLFNLSMILLYILNLCPITALYSYPYMQSAKAIYGRYLIETLYRSNAAENKQAETEESKETAEN